MVSSEQTYRVGQRRSLRGQACTIRYIGPVAAKSGEWLGVEWDDPLRGRHDGTHAGVKYFTCMYLSNTTSLGERSN
jgi:dynactin complex subunit